MAILKPKQASSAHTAGIFADMTLDGPEIGTLVAVVDRARNLPNRKTMGKQDPYCAMRLGKEAKKTETDRRGGQTPKWDQELRFTVHDSPDYYKLKCSIFNDDKKTDLIGEAWVDLTDVIKVGGGTKDVWQQLNFKGKYAGETRFELTFYDSREKPVEKKKQRETPPPIGNDVSDTASTVSGAGSRQLGPREIRRRPLPANPVAQPPTSSSATKSITISNERKPAQVQPQSQPQVPQPPPKIPLDEYQPLAISAPVPVRPYDRHSDNYSKPQVDDYEDYEEPSSRTISHHRQSLDYQQQQQQQQPQKPWQYALGRRNHDYPDSPEAYNQGPHTPQSGNHRSGRYSSTEQSPSALYAASQLDGREAWGDDRPPARHMNSDPTAAYSSPHARPPLPIAPASETQVTHFRPQHPTSISPTKVAAYRDSPLRQSINSQEVVIDPRFDRMAVPDDRPPPPPMHRDTPPRRPLSEHPPNSYVPPPLRLTEKHGSVGDRSPLQAIEDNYDAFHFVAPTAHQTPPHRSSFDAYRRPSYHESPQQQVDLYNRRRSTTEHDPYHSSHRSTPIPARSSGNFVPYDENYPMINDQIVQEPQALSYESKVQEQQPVVQQSQFSIARRPVSPNPPLAPQRGSVSPGPYPQDTSRRLSANPFGPDAYDVLNPASSPVTNAGTRYETPEQARQSTRLREAENARNHGPIIGDDGREIDPSDHLPADTWAPEPERKQKKPEHVIHIRTKTETRGPRGPKTSPLVIRNGASSYNTSPAPSSPMSAPPSSGGQRHRLQKQAPAPTQTRPLPTQPYAQSRASPAASSPLNDPQSFPQQSQNSYQSVSPTGPIRPSLSEYQVPAGNSYNPQGPAYQSQSQSQSQSQPQPHYQVPPPQMKQLTYHPGYSPNEQHHDYAPLESGYGNEYNDPLAAEMSMIDIGPPRGGRTTLRSSHGY